MTRKVLFILLGVIILSSFLRIWKLGEVPISPNWDEVSLGYNAYSILLTGRDEYGEFLPVVLRSFDDYKPALYSYLVVPSIFVFDLSVFSVRFPSAFFGTLTVLATFLLVRVLFFSSKYKDYFALTSAFLLAISPWHLQFSRVAFESNVGLAFNVFACLFFLLGLKRPGFFFLTSIFFGLNVYVYQSDKFFSPVFLLLLIIIFWRSLMNISKKYLTTAIILCVFIMIPMSYLTLFDNASLARARGVSVFTQENQTLSKIAERQSINRENKDILGLVFDNNRVVLAKKIFNGYLSHFNLNWMFISGDFDNNRHSVPGMGLLYLWEFPFLLIGIYYLFFSPHSRFPKKTKILLASWFLLAPLPAAFTNDVPHAVRTLNFLPTFQIFTSIGIVTAFVFLFKYKFSMSTFTPIFRGQLFKPVPRAIVVSIFGFVFIFNFVYFLNQYFVQQNYFYALDWQYGYEKAIEYIKPIQSNYKKIIVSNRHEFSQSHIFFLFYLKYTPSKYLSITDEKKDNEKSFANYEFRTIDYENEESGALLVGSPGDFPEVSNTVNKVYYPNGSVAIKIVEKN